MEKMRQILFIWILTLIVGTLYTLVHDDLVSGEIEVVEQFVLLSGLCLLGFTSMVLATRNLPEMSVHHYYRSILRVLLACFVAVFIGMVALQVASSVMIRLHLVYCAIAWTLTWYFVKKQWDQDEKLVG